MTADTASVTILYFAWVRERIGLSGETVAIGGPMTLSALVDQLATRSDGHALALANRERLRAAVNQLIQFI